MGLFDWFKSATDIAKINEEYIVTNSELFNRTVFGMKSPKVMDGDLLLCLGKGPGGHPKFMVGTREDENGEEPTEHITTSYLADGKPSDYGLKHQPR